MDWKYEEIYHSFGIINFHFFRVPLLTYLGVSFYLLQNSNLYFGKLIHFVFLLPIQISIFLYFFTNILLTVSKFFTCYWCRILIFIDISSLILDICCVGYCYMVWISFEFRISFIRYFSCLWRHIRERELLILSELELDKKSHSPFGDIPKWHL